jgi:DNA-binding NarL/FixJ family response regulator
MKTERPLRVFVAEDHALVREGLVLLINKQSDMEVVGEAGDGESAWRVVREVTPDVAVLDVSLPQLNGAQVATRIRTAYSHIKILGLSAPSQAGAAISRLNCSPSRAKKPDRSFKATSRFHRAKSKSCAWWLGATPTKTSPLASTSPAKPSKATKRASSRNWAWARASNSSATHSNADG